jgi:hypothetical protein
MGKISKREAKKKQKIAVEAYRLLKASQLPDQSFREKIALLQPFVRAHGALEPTTFPADVALNTPRDGLSIGDLMNIYASLRLNTMHVAAVSPVFITSLPIFVNFQNRHLLTPTKVTNTESSIWCGLSEDKWERLMERLDARRVIEVDAYSFNCCTFHIHARRSSGYARTRCSRLKALSPTMSTRDLQPI